MALGGALGSPTLLARSARGQEPSGKCRQKAHSGGVAHTLPEDVRGHVALFPWGSHAGLSQLDTGHSAGCPDMVPGTYQRMCSQKLEHKLTVAVGRTGWLQRKTAEAM